MKYMGSKSRISKHIVPILQKAIDDNEIATYIEPFSGGMNIIDKIDCDKKIGSDVNKYLIEMFKHLQSGGSLYEDVPKELYVKARTDFNNNTNIFKDWELGNIGFLASYNGRFFDGGYAKPGWEKTRYRDYYQESKNNILKQIDNLKDVKFQVNDYKSFSKIVGAVIYCDPPYENTKSYKNSTNFNHEEFWDFMRELSKKNIVFISELKAPDDFKPIWEKEVSRSMKASGKSKAQEKLFIYNDKN